jgi:enterochelin esterase-like enzyme
MRRKFLERQRSTEARPHGKQVHAAQQVQPADATGDSHRGEHPSERAAAEPEAAMKRALLAVLALLWIGFGVHGAFSYGNAYITYRGFPPPKDPVGVSPGRLLHERFFSTALNHSRSFLVYTPPGYAAAAARGRRFPVLYLLHGSPGRPSQFIDIAAAGVELDKGVDAGTLRPFLLVMPDGSDGTFRKETEWANTPHGNYESLVKEIVTTADQRFATVPKRTYRAIGGNSEGAYAALNLSLRNPKLFSIAEMWSGYGVEEQQGAFARATPALIRANSPVDYLPSLRAQLRRYPLHAYSYSGRQDKGLPRRRVLAREMAADGVHVVFRSFPGHHDWQLWRARTPAMLRFADHWFGRRG